MKLVVDEVTDKIQLTNIDNSVEDKILYVACFNTRNHIVIRAFIPTRITSNEFIASPVLYTRTNSDEINIRFYPYFREDSDIALKAGNVQKLTDLICDSNVCNYKVTAFVFNNQAERLTAISQLLKLYNTLNNLDKSVLFTSTFSKISKKFHSIYDSNTLNYLYTEGAENNAIPTSRDKS